jgi:predicted CoA-substrate-specific enzyme activase
MTRRVYLGVDCGSVTTKAALIDEEKNVVAHSYQRNKNVIDSVEECLGDLRLQDYSVLGCGVTGSGRNFVKIVINADIAKTEILAHTIAALEYYPEVRTVLDIGGEDCKLITIEDGIFSNFAMNSICAAGTGSVMENIADRLDVRIEEFADLALQSRNELNLPGKCGIFLSSAVVSRKNMGYSKSDILMGVCRAIIRNYLSVCGKDADLAPPCVFQGGVSLNGAVVKALEEELGHEVIVPEHNTVMGAIGMALLAMEAQEKSPAPTRFNHSFHRGDFSTFSFKCGDCTNNCEVTQVYSDSRLLGAINSRCGVWDSRVNEARDPR